MGIEIRRIGDTVDLLGEGLLWDDRRNLLYWIDSIGKFVRRLDLDTGERHEFSVPSEIGCIVMRCNGGLLGGLRNGIYAIDPETGVAEPANLIDTGRTDQRFNDGKVDRQGRFVVGTMHARSPADKKYFGSLYRVDHDLSHTLLETGIGCSNGPCWSPDGRTFYFTDSPKRMIWAYDYDTATGAISNKRDLIDTSPFNSPADGQTVDAEGCLWTTYTQARKIGRYDARGKEMQIIDVPFAPTNVAFGGRDLDILFVTSMNRTPNVQVEGPGAGWLYTIYGLGVRGLPDPRFAG
jgi:L-arabinonolactonase